MNAISGINETIYDNICCHLSTYGVDDHAQAKLKQFLQTRPNDFAKRQGYAEDSIKSILNSHGKADLSEEIVFLAEIEKHVMPIQDKLRDHVTHAILSFLLGIYLIKNLQLENKITPFQWKMTSLLHDIAYPYEIAFNLSKQIENHINSMAKKYNVYSPSLKSRNTISNLEKLARSPSSINLLTSRFKKWGFGFSAGALYKKMKSEHNVDHGIISSMLLLKSLDVLYEHHNSNRKREYCLGNNNDWNYANFEKEIVDSCASIFIHNLPSVLFRNKKISKIDHPLPFILRLSDELQDWERMTFNKSGGIHDEYTYNPGEMYSIEVNDNKIYFNVPEDRRDKINNSLSCFAGQSIIIS